MPARQQDNTEVRASYERKDSCRTPTDLRCPESGVVVSEVSIVSHTHDGGG